MKTFILPGFSLKNKGWAEEVKSKLPEHLNSQVIYWKHWQTENNNDWDPESEARTIIELIGTDQVNIIAKSLGSYVASLVLQLTSDKIEKLILCGIPLHDMTDQEQNRMAINLRVIAPQRLLCIQNAEDPHAQYEEVKQFLESVNPAINLTQKDRSDHEYPYFEEYKYFMDIEKE